MSIRPLSFAEVLRDEYLYLHDEPPTARVDIEPSHIRELSHLLSRMRQSAQGRYALLARNCQGDDVAGAFRTLLGSETLLQDLAANDADLAKTFETNDVLGRLLRVPGARCAVFLLPRLAFRVVNTREHVEVFLCESAAVRLLYATSESRQIFSPYPALLATIADDRNIEQALIDGSGAAKGQDLREKLVKKFTPARRRIWERFRRPDDRIDTNTSAGDPAKVRQILGLPPGDEEHDARDRRRHDRQRALFNAILLEVAFPAHLPDNCEIRSLNANLHDRNTAALCLSGGGVRSATFNLGIMQGLSDHGLLQRFHYLSTVSGGGYIGSWLSSWSRRHTEGFPGVARDLSAGAANPEEPEVPPIRNLRAYSSYLAPRAAALSADTWTLIATYFRNLLLNWTILLPLLVAVLALPRLIEWAVMQQEAVILSARWAVITLATALVAIVGVAAVRPADGPRSGRPRSAAELRAQRRKSWLWLLPLLASSISSCVFWASLHWIGPSFLADVATGWMQMVGSKLPRLFATGGFIGALIYCTRRLLASVAGEGFVARLKSFYLQLWSAPFIGRAIGEIAAATAAGTIAGFLLSVLGVHVFDANRLFASSLLTERFVCLGPGLFLLSFFAAATLLVGFTTSATTDHDREWWARSAAAMFVAGIVYIGACASVVFLPIALAQLPGVIGSVGGVSAAVSWLLAKTQKRMPRTKDERQTSHWTGIALKGTAVVTLLVVVAALSLATSWLLVPTTSPSWQPPSHILRWTTEPATTMHLRALREATLGDLWGVIKWTVLTALVMSIFLNANVYSMHGMYRNRLIRAYLGASRWERRPDPFTGFDPDDDIDLFELRAEALWPTSFVDFRAFAKRLADTKLFGTLTQSIRQRLQAYLQTQDPSLERELRTEVARALNERMVSLDLKTTTEAPRSAALFTANRLYLDEVFAGLIPPRPIESKGLSPGALRKRRATRDPNDDFRTQDRSKEEERIYRILRRLSQDRSPMRGRPPLHIINAALNLVGGDNLAWQERKADSFTFSPLHCGNRRLGYRDSFDFGRHVSLGTALAISGAAVSSNSGYQSSPIVTFLMTLFNARLGWWLGNPSRPTYNKAGPTSTLQSLVNEALGMTNDQSDYIFLSDGGHFDNLGLYEMVRRRCRHIVVCDATADRKYAFADLGNAVRKIRVDMGISITLSTAYLAPEPSQKFGRYCAIGLIHYGDVDVVSPEHRYGHLLYIKPAAYCDCPPDVRNYQRESDGFPHESTADQFFGESQFESYRALGRHIIGQICGDRLSVDSRQASGIAAFIGWAKDYIDEKRDHPPKSERCRTSA